MKAIKLFFTLPLFLLFTLQPCEAQILKKLQKKVETSAERAVLNKAGQKTEKEVEKGMDNVLEGDKNRTKTPKSSATGATQLKDTYSFDYLYKMKITSQQEEIVMDYFLTPDAPYAGMKMNQQGMNMFMIMQEDVMHTFMDMGGQKIRSSVSLDYDPTENEEDLSNYKITALPDKNILGYNCKGVQMENEESKYVLYYTNEADVSFTDLFKSSQAQQKQSQNIPHALRQIFDPKENSLVLSMEITDKVRTGKRSQSGKMECISLDKTNFTFNTSGYISY